MVTITHFKDVSFSDPADNILYDELLLNAAEQGRLMNTLRLWESPVPFIVLGRIGKVAQELNEPVVRQDGVAVLRRSSGGGTVVQGPGCLNFAYILSKETEPALNDLRRCYQLILADVLTVLKSVGVAARFYPTSDLAFGEGRKKFSGNAQRRGRKSILHHGTVLYDFNLDLINRYLAMPRDIPAYRESRPHHEFVANIPVTIPALKQAFRRFYRVADTGVETQPSAQETLELRQMLSARPPLVVL